ncbi:MAG TPA: ROK family transcriptional regulator [Burkholderiaceae bacterium]|nr:ROK family transcriptional regulator [Burkholderiaceae bacterium]
MEVADSVITSSTRMRDARLMRGSNHNGMRQFNERIVLQAIRHHGAIAKADIARLTQLSTQTVAIIVSRLERDDLLIKQARVRGKIGQPSVPLSLNPQGAFSLGLQVGRRSLEVVVTDFLGQTRHQLQFSYPYPDPQVVLPNIQQALVQIQQAMGENWSRTVGIGLTAPLSMHLWSNLLGEASPQSAAALKSWEHFDLKSAVQALTDLPVEFAKDTTSACMAEMLQGHGISVNNFLYVFVGTFVGGGLVIAGHIMSGQNGNAGAIGSLPMGLAQGHDSEADKLNQPNTPQHSLPPQLLQLASGWQLEQALAQAGLDPLVVHQDLIMDDQYSAYTQVWLAQASRALAMTITSATALLDLDAAVIDGSLGPSLIAALIKATREQLKNYQLEGLQTPQVLAGKVGSHARAIGGALLPLHTQFFPLKDIFLKQDLV